tara:strand:- start:44 stop:241 length:198 start_codon:yes stop_codon:yes gene_type:complete
MGNYLYKIAYHLACGNEDKFNYFFDRQVKMFGPLTGADLEYITTTRDAIMLDWGNEMKEFNAHIG